MKRIIATTTAVLALGALGAGSALAGVNIGSQNAQVGQGSGAFAMAGNLFGGGGVNVNVSTSRSSNGAVIGQSLCQVNGWFIGCGGVG